jgi:carboxyl-terminal processing protease
MGKAGRSQALALLDGDDQPVELSIERRPPPREPVGFGHLPPSVVHSRDALLDEGRVGYLWFDTFLMPAPQLYTDAMVGFIEANVDGVVIDVRGNPGGLVGMVRGMAGHLVGDKTSLGTMVYRDPTMGPVRLELRIAPRPASQRFDGPVAILVDRVTVSTGEVFAAGLQGIGRARVFGVQTPGMAMPSIIEELPNGDSLQMPMGESLDPGGSRLEKDGVVPDEVVGLTREAFADGRDPVLDAALVWLADQRSAAATETDQPAESDSAHATEDTP